MAQGMSEAQVPSRKKITSAVGPQHTWTQEEDEDDR